MSYVRLDSTASRARASGRVTISSTLAIEFRSLMYIARRAAFLHSRVERFMNSVTMPAVGFPRCYFFTLRLCVLGWFPTLGPNGVFIASIALPLVCLLIGGKQKSSKDLRRYLTYAILTGAAASNGHKEQSHYNVQ